MSLYHVDMEACIRCGLCSELCVAGIVEKDAENRPFVAEKREKDCIRCGQCVVFCPEACNSLAFSGPDADRYAMDCPLVPASALPSAESAEIFLRSRRSIRKFKKEGVSREILTRIFDTVRYAPTASNSQEVRWVVVETREKTEALEREIVDFFRTSQGQLPPSDPRAMTMRYVVDRWDAGVPIIFRGAPQLAVAVVPADKGMVEDGAIALTYLELAAKAYGVGCCWGGFFTHACRASQKLRDSLGIHRDEYVTGAQMLGYSALPAGKRLPPRKKADIVWL